MKEFDKAFKQLNPAQKQAVDSIEGPVLVIAGPGTGKTQLLSVRAANIIGSTDAFAENILCLTFTNSAARNLKQRIIDLVGSDGQRVVVKTFHSFAAEIISLYPDYFFNAARMDAAPEAVQLEGIESSVEKLPL